MEALVSDKESIVSNSADIEFEYLKQVIMIKLPTNWSNNVQNNAMQFWTFRENEITHNFWIFDK